MKNLKLSKKTLKKHKNDDLVNNGNKKNNLTYFFIIKIPKQKKHVLIGKLIEYKNTFYEGKKQMNFKLLFFHNLFVLKKRQLEIQIIQNK